MRTGWMAAMSLCLCAAVAVPQTAVPPPPRPADAGPGVDATFAFLQQKVSGIGKLMYANYVHDNADGSDWIVQQTFELSNVRASVPGCSLSFHSTASSNGKNWQDTDLGIPFRELEDVVVTPIEQIWKVDDSRKGHTTWNYRSDPAVLVLRARRRNNGGYNDVYFIDPALADRVAKAMTRAIELCGGGNKDPF